jgi:putative hemolysin
MSNDPLHIDNALLGRLLGLDECRSVYRAAQRASSGSFADRILGALDIRPDAEPSALDLVPKTGAVIVAANHPHGAVDGLLMAALLQRIRPDVRVLTNYVLARIPELSDFCLFVDPFEQHSAAGVARSQPGLRAAHLWLRRGGALVVFPAGEVAHRPGVGGTRADSPWRSTVGRLATATGATVVPALIEGGNSRWFYASGRVHAMLRTALLARELLNKRGATVRVRFGRALAKRELDSGSGTAHTVTAVIREAVERLRVCQIVGAVPTSRIEAELAALPASAHLTDDGTFSVFCTQASSIPAVLEEIGRLREITYRAAGEGTGRATDLDAFDNRYLHLFTWDRKERQIVGAYRIGETDHIVARYGVAGLYTRSLFRYDQGLVDRLSPALELGRSFVRPEYQRNYGALLSLWKGIGRLVVLNPQYRVLFGTVSVSTRYTDTTHQLLMQFLSHNHRDDQLAELAIALNPPTQTESPTPLGLVPRSIDEVNRLVSASEPDGKGVPVLLRQYLKLDAKLIGFNVDPQFGDALDALMMVDLTKVDRAILNRYLGREGAASFLAVHQQPAVTVAA